MLPEFASVLADAKTGCSSSVTTIYRAFHPALFRYLRFQEPSEAEDLAAEVWLTVARTLGDFEGDARAFLAWIFTVARRRVSDVRRKRFRRQTSTVASLDGMLPPDRATCEAVAIESDALRRALGALSAAQAEVVTLRVVCDLSVDDVAVLVGRTPEAVRALQHRALRRLATALGANSPEAVTA